MTERSEIRAWLAANLMGSDDAGARVLARRALPLAKDLEPTLVFAIQNERSTDISMGGTQERVDMLRVTACAKGDAAETEDVLDRLGIFVEGVLGDDPRMGDLIATYEYQGTEFSFAGEGEQTLCTAALTFALTYYSNRTRTGIPAGAILLRDGSPIFLRDNTPLIGRAA